MDSIYVRFIGQLFRQTAGVPVGANSAPLLTDLFLYSYENEFLDKLIMASQRKLARKFNLSYRHILMNLSLSVIISDIYPKELTISVITESASVASYFDLFLREMKTTI